MDKKKVEYQKRNDSCIVTDDLSFEDLKRKIRLHIQAAEDIVKQSEIKRLQNKELTSEEKVLLAASI